MDIINNCQKNDPKAQRELFERYSPEVFQLALKYVQNDLDAEDVVVETFYQAFKAMPLATFVHVRLFECWLSRIAVNQALTKLRQRTKEHKVPLDRIPEPQEWPSIELDFNHRELLDQIEKLPPGCKTVLQLSALEGFNHQEIAQMCGITSGTSRSQLFKARQILAGLINCSKAKK